ADEALQGLRPRRGAFLPFVALPPRPRDVRRGRGLRPERRGRAQQPVGTAQAGGGGGAPRGGRRGRGRDSGFRFGRDRVSENPRMATPPAPRELWGGRVTQSSDAV